MNIEPMELPTDIKPIELDDRGDKKEDKHDKIIIVDADTIVFASCSVCQHEVQVMGPDFMSDEEMAYARKQPYWDEAEMTYMSIDPQDALRHASDKLELILDKIGGKLENTILHFTGGRDSFRYSLLQNAFPDDEEMHYKWKRTKKPRPVGLQIVKELMCAVEGTKEATIWYDFEADDVAVRDKMRHGEEAILVAVDKDAWKNTPGRHFNYYESELYNIEMKWVEVSEEDARFHQHLQAITGDKSDNIPGLKGIGPAKALKFIEPGMTDDELWDGVVTAYTRHCTYGEPLDMAILNRQLVDMHQLDEEGVIQLWQP